VRGERGYGADDVTMHANLPVEELAGGKPLFGCQKVIFFVWQRRLSSFVLRHALVAARLRLGLGDSIRYMIIVAQHKQMCKSQLEDDFCLVMFYHLHMFGA